MTSITTYEPKRYDIDYYKNLVAVAAKSGNYNMPPETMLNIMLTAQDLGISPMKALNGGFYVVNGKISMSTALMADRIRKEGHSIKIPEWTSEKCVIIGVRKDNGDSIKFEYTMEDAKNAGLTNSPTWKKFPKQMLYNRAMSTLARTLFPDVVGNAYSEDEKYDILNVPPEKRPVEDPDTITVPAAVCVQDEERMATEAEMDQILAIVEGNEDVYLRTLTWAGVKEREPVKLKHVNKILQAYEAKKAKSENKEQVA